MPIFRNKIGIRYNRLIVIKFAGWSWNGYSFQSSWLCRCDCGKEKIIQGRNLQSNHTKSCGCFNREMSSKINSIKQMGENNSCYINGKSCGKHTKAIYELKEKIRKRDNHTCQECGITQEEHIKKCNHKLPIHHIDGDDTNNAEENMITLCIGCHNKKR